MSLFFCIRGLSDPLANHLLFYSCKNAFLIERPRFTHLCVWMHLLHAKQTGYESICQHVLQRSYLISKGLWSSLWLDWNETLSLSLCVFTARRSKVFWQRKKQSYKCHWRDITSMLQLFPTHSYNSMRCERCQSISHV